MGRSTFSTTLDTYDNVLDLVIAETAGSIDAIVNRAAATIAVKPEIPAEEANEKTNLVSLMRESRSSTILERKTPAPSSAA